MVVGTLPYDDSSNYDLICQSAQEPAGSALPPGEAKSGKRVMLWRSAKSSADQCMQYGTIPSKTHAPESVISFSGFGSQGSKSARKEKVSMSGPFVSAPALH